MRDKHWSRELRKLWPEFTKVCLEEHNFSKHLRDRNNWCQKQSGRYWHCGAGRCWYFEHKKTAFLFKLTWYGRDYQNGEHDG